MSALDWVKALCLQAAAQRGKGRPRRTHRVATERIRDEIIDGGGIALAVPTDITDDEAVDSLIDADGRRGYGGADVVINNAFAMPSMKPLARTDFEQITAGLELTVLGTLRVIKAFTEPLEASKGSIVNINSMVIRHSEPRYVSFKLAKSALLAMSQTLATELGDKSPYQQRRPGYIWDDQLRSGTSERSPNYGITH